VFLTVEVCEGRRAHLCRRFRRTGGLHQTTRLETLRTHHVEPGPDDGESETLMPTMLEVVKARQASEV